MYNEIPTQVSELNNDVGYVTADSIPEFVSPDWEAENDQSGYILNKPAFKKGDGEYSLVQNNGYSQQTGNGAISIGAAGSLHRLGISGPANATTYTYTISMELSKQTLDKINKNLTFISYGTTRANVTGIDTSKKTITLDKTLSSTELKDASVFISAHNIAKGYYSTAIGVGTAALDRGSHSEGYLTTASQSDSHAEGISTIQSGGSSHSEGNNTVASSYDAHAEGNSTTQSGKYSHQQGKETEQSGVCQHAEGEKCKASGDHSHQEGYYSIALGGSQHAEGDLTRQSGSYAHAEGANTDQSGIAQHSEGIMTVASSAYSHAGGSYSEASGKGAYAHGVESYTFSITLTGDANAKTYNYELIDEKILISMVQAQNAFIGYPRGDNTKTMITEVNSTGNGTGTITLSKTLSNVAITEKDYTVLCFNLSSATASHSEGAGTVASGDGQHSEGIHSVQSGKAAHSEGEGGVSSGDSAHAEGYVTEALGDYSHSEGMYTTASDMYCHAEGFSTTASSTASHAEGNHSIQSGITSYAGGNYTVASGACSHAEGNHTVANHKSQSVSGEYNVADPSTASELVRGTYVEIVGKGTADNARSNARTLDWSGNEWLSGTLKIGGTGYNDESAKEIATKEYVDNAIAALETSLKAYVDDAIARYVQTTANMSVTGTTLNILGEE